MTRSGAQSVETAGSGGRTAYLLSPPAILLTPLVIFLRHHGYSLAAPEALISMALLAGLGIVLGIPGWLGGRIPAILILACILTLVLDIQLQWFSAWNFRVLGVGLAFALALWLLGKHLSTL